MKSKIPEQISRRLQIEEAGVETPTAGHHRGSVHRASSGATLLYRSRQLVEIRENE